MPADIIPINKYLVFETLVECSECRNLWFAVTPPVLEQPASFECNICSKMSATAVLSPHTAHLFNDGLKHIDKTRRIKQPAPAVLLPFPTKN